MVFYTLSKHSFIPCSLILVMYTQKKLVLIGDSACGKTSLIEVFDNKELPKKHFPTELDDYFINITVRGTTINLHMSDNSGEKLAHSKGVNCFSCKNLLYTMLLTFSYFLMNNSCTKF